MGSRSSRHNSLRHNSLVHAQEHFVNRQRAFISGEFLAEPIAAIESDHRYSPNRRMLRKAARKAIRIVEDGQTESTTIASDSISEKVAVTADSKVTVAATSDPVVLQVGTIPEIWMIEIGNHQFFADRARFASPPEDASPADKAVMQDITKLIEAATASRPTPPSGLSDVA